MSGVSIVQFKVTILDTNPVVWRRIEAPSNMSLNALHYAINGIIGWRGHHLYSFRVGGFDYSDVDNIYMDPPENDDRKIKLLEAFQISPIIEYTYDFGDDWRHVLEFEGEKAVDPKEKYPICIKGENSCPPEDIGGSHGFEDFKEVMANPKHPKYEEMLEWSGYEFNPHEFDVELANLKAIRKKTAKNLKLKAF